MFRSRIWLGFDSGFPSFLSGFVGAGKAFSLTPRRWPDPPPDQGSHLLAWDAQTPRLSRPGDPDVTYGVSEAWTRCS